VRTEVTGWWRPAAAAATSPAVAGGEQFAARGGVVAFGALVAFTCLLLLAPQSFIPALGALHLPLLCALVAGGAYVSDRLSRHERLVDLTPPMRLALMLAGWALLTVPLSLWPGGSVKFFFGIYFKALVVFALLAGVVDSLPRLKTLAWTLSLLAAPLSLAAIKNYVSGGGRAEALTEGLDRIMGYNGSLTANPNDLALMLNLILPLSIALFLSTRRLVPRLLLVGLIALDGIAIVASFSRAGFLVLGMTGFLYLCILFRRRLHGLALLVIAGAMMAAAMLPSSYLERLSTITNIQADKTNSAQTRYRDYLTAAGYVVEHPLMGAGIGMDILALNEARGETWTKVHDVYLEYAVDLGVPGVVLFLLLLRAIMRDLGRARRQAATEPDGFELHALLEGVSVSLAGFMLAALFYPDAYQFYFYYMAGLAVAGIAITARRRAVQEVPA
jgi:O-antigen ligase